MYVDESGDTGLDRSPTSYFALSGLVVHESQWRNFINQLIAFRKTMRSVYLLPVGPSFTLLSSSTIGLRRLEEQISDATTD